MLIIMAGSSEVDDELVPGLKTKITEIINRTTTPDMEQETESNSSQVLPLLEEKQKCEQELFQLENEIQLLEEKLRERETEATENLSHIELSNVIKQLQKTGPPHLSPVNKSVSGKHSQLAEQTESIEALAEQSESIEKEIELMSTVTGINFTTVQNKVLKKESAFMEKTHRVAGISHCLQFEVEFKETSTQEAEDSWKSHISDLKIAVHKDVIAEIEDILEKLEDENAIQPFFQMFQCYARWIAHRQQTLTHFKAKYPDNVTLPHGSSGPYLVIHHSSSTGANLLIWWTFEMTAEYVCVPRVQLYVKAQKELIDMDTKGVLQDTPSKFSKLLQTLGIEQAIDIMIGLHVDEEDGVGV